VFHDENSVAPATVDSSLNGRAKKFQFIPTPAASAGLKFTCYHSWRHLAVVMRLPQCGYAAANSFVPHVREFGDASYD
jgi:hypothetical protein